MDVDFCRGLAGAVLNDPEKVTFVALKASERFPALLNRAIDVLVRNTTWTYSREVQLKLQFPATLFFDSEAFMVPANSPARTVADLKGATICLTKGTTHEQNLADYARTHNMTFVPLVSDSVIASADAFFAGRCQAYTADASTLAAERLRGPGGEQAFRILDERISEEPLGPVVRRGDDDWFTIVRWVLYALVLAEERGITQENVDAEVLRPDNIAFRRLAGIEGSVSKSLRLSDGWAVRVVKSIGNYGELFERNLGRASPLKLERRLNRLRKDGGLLYVPPVN
jgi:general L-amino acid transport system substrate-binding protein